MIEDEKIKKSLNKFSEDLDQDTESQLNNMRQKALATNIKPIKHQWHQNISWNIMGPALATMVLITVLMVSNQNPSIEPETNVFLDDLDLLTYELDTDLLEDLEFIAWLENENILEGELL